MTTTIVESRTPVELAPTQGRAPAAAGGAFRVSCATAAGEIEGPRAACTWLLDVAQAFAAAA